jgi:hypothetical protein
MVAYNFQPRFFSLIREGMKHQTIRRLRVGHAKPGDRLQLYTGLRTPQARRICDDPVCTAVMPCEIRFASALIRSITVGGVPVRNLNNFAVIDGFTDLADMTGFWREMHGTSDFNGVVIEWAMPRADHVMAPRLREFA